MSLQTIQISQSFNAPIKNIFDTLSDHETFGKLIGVSMKRVKDGETCANGLGSIRDIKIGPLPSFQETITGFVVGQFIEYKITKGSPIKNHVGSLKFSEANGVTTLDYTIKLESKIPFTTGLIKAALGNGIRKGLKQYSNSL